MLEELGLPYEVNPINLGKSEQFSAEFLSISPNNKIPAIVDHDAEGGPLAIFESGAILTYLAEKTGRFLAASGADRYSALEWLHWQIGGYGPMLGQLGFFGVRSSDKAPLAIQRFSDESERLLTVMENRLSSNPYLAGGQYTIADIATYPWTLAASTFLKPILGEGLANKPAIQRWMNGIAQRPAVQRGMLVPVLP